MTTTREALKQAQEYLSTLSPHVREREGAKVIQRLIATISIAEESKPAEKVTIGGDGLFAGIEINIDPTLPADTAEIRSGENRLRLNIKTGETTKLAKPAPDGVKLMCARLRNMELATCNDAASMLESIAALPAPVDAKPWQFMADDDGYKRITELKTKSIIDRDGFRVSGYILNNGDKMCLSYGQAIRWMSAKELYNVMHCIPAPVDAKPDITQHHIDSAALGAAVKIMDIVNGSWLPGGAPQVKAKIQCAIIDLLKSFTPMEPVDAQCDRDAQDQLNELLAAMEGIAIRGASASAEEFRRLIRAYDAIRAMKGAANAEKQDVSVINEGDMRTDDGPKQGDAHRIMLAAGFSCQYDNKRGVHTYSGYIEDAERALSKTPAHPASGAVDEPTERMIDDGLEALLQCTSSELESYSPKLLDGYTDDVTRVYKAMRSAALSAVNQVNAAQPEPIGYIDRKDIARLSNYKAMIWPGTNEIDAVAVYLAAPQEAARCKTCDGTGDVHGIDGEWRGECTVCEAAQPDGLSSAIERGTKAWAGTPAGLVDDLRGGEEDAGLLDWLDENIFHREMDDWDKERMPTMNMWVMFAPKGVQGAARNIIRAAIAAQPAKQQENGGVA